MATPPLELDMTASLDQLTARVLDTIRRSDAP
jgi:hypothetical protein